MNASMTPVILLVIFGSTAWLAFDASRRDWRHNSFAKSAAVWVVGSVALWIVVFPLYLVMRGQAPLKHGTCHPIRKG
jgi:hypothetical protein